MTYEVRTELGQGVVVKENEHRRLRGMLQALTAVHRGCEPRIRSTRDAMFIPLLSWLVEDHRLEGDGFTFRKS